MSRRVLHVLSQRPSHTGSGITLDAIVRHAAAAGWEQAVVCGVPAEDPAPPVGGLPAERVHPLVFDSAALPFPLPGMSDVMPYRSSRWSALTAAQLDAYRAAWRQHLAAVIAAFEPDLIHSHHLWLVSALLKDVAPSLPVVTTCHATGLRQMTLCPHLADAVVAGVRRNDRFLVLHDGMRDRVVAALGVQRERVAVVGAGYREEVFTGAAQDGARGATLAYAGKYSHAKGLPELLDAFERLAATHPDLVLHVAGAGAGAEADALRERMAALAPRVVMHGMLSQAALAELLARCAVFVLPSFYEGLPLVLVEALASGCRLVSTALPGVVSQIAPFLGDALTLAPLPRLKGDDVPEEADLPRFVDDLTAALGAALAAGPLGRPGAALLAPLSWRAVFERVAAEWRSVAPT